jgi:hypothetical protein
MFEWLLRDYEKVVRRLFESESGIIENENCESPIPGVIQVASARVQMLTCARRCCRRQNF